MYKPFEQLSDSSRIWVYSANRELTESEIKEITVKLFDFTTHWQSHQNDVSSSFTILKNRFVLIASDESQNAVSGCGIDKSVKAIQELEEKLSLSLLEKRLVYFEINGKTTAIPLSKIKDYIANNQISTDTLFYNTLISNIKELKTSFLIQSSEGWITRYFNTLVS